MTDVVDLRESSSPKDIQLEPLMSNGGLLTEERTKVTLTYGGYRESLHRQKGRLLVGPRKQ